RSTRARDEDDAADRCRAADETSERNRVDRRGGERSGDGDDDRRSEPRSRRDSHDVGIGERIAEEALIRGSRGSERSAEERGQDDARHANRDDRHATSLDAIGRNRAVTSSAEESFERLARRQLRPTEKDGEDERRDEEHDAADRWNEPRPSGAQELAAAIRHSSSPPRGRMRDASVSTPSAIRGPGRETRSSSSA